MIRDRLSDKISSALNALLSEGELPAADYPSIEIIETRGPEHGDYSTNFAMASAKAAGLAPRAIAEKLAERLSKDEAIEKTEVAGPGFLNLFLDPAWTAAQLLAVCASEGRSVLKDADHYAHRSVSSPQRINVEFVSVNPNGPITIGSGRGAAYGSTLCNVLEAAGHSVHREYYVNDGVNSEQMRQFTESAAYFWIVAGGDTTAVPPEKGYMADYVQQTASRASKAYDMWLAAIDSQMTSSEEAVSEWKRVLSLPFPAGMEEFQKHWLEEYRKEKDSLANREFVLTLLKAAKENQIDLVHVFREANNRHFLSALQDIAQDLMLEKQREDLSAFGTTFDLWFHEQELHETKRVQEDIQKLIQNGMADEEPHRAKITFAKGGAIKEVEIEDQPQDEDDVAGIGKTLWLRSTKLGDDMDRVLRRKDGRYTYISSDITYHQDKLHRPENADKMITVLGPDHHGYIARLQAVLAASWVQPTSEGAELTEEEAKIWSTPQEKEACQIALAEARKRLEVQIFQLVRFLKDGKPAPMRKRDGNIYALIDLINEIGEKVKPNGSTAEKQEAGTDVARFFYLMRHHDTTFDFDLDLAEKQSDENPVFYVQYAHARICSVIDKAAEAGFTPTESWSPNKLTHPREKALTLKIWELPNEIERCAEDYAVNRIATYAVELARTYHHFYDACRVIDKDDPETSRARLALCVAARTALRSALDLLGVSAPTRMERTEAS